MTDNCIDISGVSKSFGRTQAVRNLDLRVPRGSLCGFLGPNGAGKSTTIRMIMSIIYPDTGAINVLGSSALENKDRIGYLPEERGLYRKMRVADFLVYMGRLKGVAGPGLRQKVMQGLERVQLGDVHRKKCEELSKGMQQKVQFLAAIIHEPELLILDEPFSGLDPVNAELMHQMIKEMNDAGTTIIFSTHVLHQAEQLCSRFFLINKGTKLLDSTLAEIRQRFDPRTISVEPLADGVDFGKFAGVAAVRPLPHTTALELELEEDGDPQTVMRQIMSTTAVRSIELRRLSLDEVFIRMVRRDIGEEAATQAAEELSHV